MDDEKKQQLAAEIEEWKSSEDAEMGDHPLWDQQTAEEDLEEQDECEFVDRVHFDAVADILEALLDKLTDDTDTRNKLLVESALVSLGEYASETLSDKERAIVDRMTRRIIAGGRLDLVYGAYQPEPYAVTARRLGVADILGET